MVSMLKPHDRSVSAWLAGATVVLLATGCGGDAASTTSQATTPTTATNAANAAPASTTALTDQTTTAASAAETTAPSCPPLTDTDVTSDGFPGRLSTLVGAAIRTGVQPCSERVVVELHGDGEFPGWRVRYQASPLTDDPRGEPVDVAGSAFIVVTIESWMTTMEGAGYQGPTRITPTNVTHIKELVLLGNFESVTTWAIGVDQQRPFHVSTLDGPPRLVIEIATP
jgi:hypothetical protein